MDIHAEEVPASAEVMGLPAQLYNSEEAFQRDLKAIISNEWHLAGHVSMWASAGDFHVWELAGESLVTVRGNDGKISTFFNVCRHRGSRICLDVEGNNSRLVCPYHAWTYDLTGRLIAASGLPESIPRESLSLKSVATMEFHGLVLINLSANADAAHLAKLNPFFDVADLASTRIAARRRFDADVNWKIEIQNFLECYHCYGTHPEYLSVNSRDMVGAIARGGAEVVKAVQNASKETLERPLLEPVFGPEQMIAIHRPLRSGYSTGSKSGRPVAPLLGRRTKYDGTSIVLTLNPFVWVSIYNDYSVLYRFVPQGRLRTEVEAIWLVKDTAVEGVDFQMRELLWLWESTLTQDRELVKNTQLGVLSRAYTAGPYCADEQLSLAFDRWYLRKIEATP